MSHRDMVRRKMFGDDKNKNVNNFMDNAVGSDEPMFNEDSSNAYDHNVGFMQKNINMFNEVNKIGEPLKEDGVLGPKTMAQTQNMLKSLPPEMKRYAVNALYKEFNKSEGDAGSSGVEGFEGAPKKDDTSIGEY